MSSTQETREAAARAWSASAKTHEDDSALRDAIDNPDGWWFMPDGSDSSAPGGRLRALAAWKEWAKADAANAAPVAPDPLEGVTWETPRQIVEWGEATRANSMEAWLRISSSDRGLIVGHEGARGDIRHANVIAHARAQLARESAPVAPAVTLEALREGAKALGWRVVHESGYERPDVILTRMLQYKQLTAADWDEYQRRVLAVRDALTDDAERMAVVDAEIARLRALGVTPAVLS